MATQTVMAIAAHPDDIEFMMAGTLLLLKQRGWTVHYMNLANGCCGTGQLDPETIAAIRLKEAEAACGRLGANFHPPLVDDLQVYHTPELVAQVTSVIRDAAPDILLLQSPQDYMEDHMNASRVGVTAAFARGMRNAHCAPPRAPIANKVAVYHALPYGLRGPLGEAIQAHQFVDVTPVIDEKRAMLAEHRSQKEWLDVSQGLDAYLDTLTSMTRDVGRQSGAFDYAEGWRKRLHLGFCDPEDDPLAEALGDACIPSAKTAG